MAEDTIFALATPIQPAPTALVRVSGPHAPLLARTLAKLDWQRAARKCELQLYGSPVPALALTLPAPRSFTGEDCLELILPGNSLLVAALEDTLRHAGCRDAEAGEFTRRALSNHKLDLSRAEGLLRLINAGTDAQRLAAMRDLSGESGRELGAIAAQLRALSARYEMSFDFSEEEHADASGAGLDDELAQVATRLRAFAATPRPAGTRPVVALYGPPNAGKSSLFNALLGRARSLVSDTPGTTRDPVEAELPLAGATLLLRDLSGVGAADADHGRFGDTAREGALAADLLLLVCAPGDEPELEGAFGALCQADADLRARSLWVCTKSDLDSPGGTTAGLETLAVSALTGAGIDVLRHRLTQALSELTGSAMVTLQSLRAADALARLDAPLANRGTPPEAAAADVRAALRLLDEALLSDAPGDVLDLIFSQFCIGK